MARSFFDRDARVVAPELLNKVLVVDDAGVGRLAARIVEVEAYCGADDPGAHSYRGLTPRTKTMFGPPGHLYVYLSYGMHWCANAVCGPGGQPHAVLLRAAAPLEGTNVMWARRPRARRQRDLCSGPAKLTQSMGITGDDDGQDLCRSHIQLVDDGTVPPSDPEVSTRIGLATGKGDESLWRFAVSDDENVSR